MHDRWIGIGGHAAIAAVLLGWSIWAGWTFWRGLLGADWAALGALLALDATALWGFVLHVRRIPSPFTSFRHALPMLSALPLLHSIHQLTATTSDPLVAWLIAGALAGALAWLAWLAWRGLEQLLLSDHDLMLAMIEQRAMRAEHAARQIAAESRAAVRIVAVLREAVAEHDRLVAPMLPATLPRQSCYPEPVPATMPADQMARQATPAACAADRRYACPRCGMALTQGQYGSAVRRGYCRHCRHETEMQEAYDGHNIA